MLHTPSGCDHIGRCYIPRAVVTTSVDATYPQLLWPHRSMLHTPSCCDHIGRCYIPRAVVTTSVDASYPELLWPHQSMLHTPSWWKKLCLIQKINYTAVHGRVLFVWVTIFNIFLKADYVHCMYEEGKIKYVAVYNISGSFFRLYWAITFNSRFMVSWITCQ
jgi:hypothetical protein